MGKKAKCRIERGGGLSQQETVGLDSFSMILFIKIESSCHNINFLQFTFIKHGTQAFSINYYFPIFITSLALQWQYEVRHCGGWKGEDEGWKSKRETFSELRHSFENCSPHVVTCSVIHVWNFIFKYQRFYLKTMNQKYVSTYS